MLYIMCVEVLACKIRSSSHIEGFLLPGAGGVQFRLSQYADDTTVFVKTISSLYALFETISLYEKGTGARLNLSKTEAMWLGAWKFCQDEPLGLTWVKKMKILGVFFGTVSVDQDNWEPRLSKLDKCLCLWKARSLSYIGKALILNVLGLSKLMFVSRILEPPKWVLSKVNSLLWPFLWGSRVETVARKHIVCSVTDGGLGLRDFVCHGKALRLSALFSLIRTPLNKGFYLIKYFCGARLASLRPEWSMLRDNLTPSAALPSAFYSIALQSLASLRLPSDFSFSSKAFYGLFLKASSTIPFLPGLWTPSLLPRFSLERHWSLVRDQFTENFKNDLAWLISLRAIKVRRSLRDWGYINSSRCASCPRDETIDHCFLNCSRVKPVWSRFLPLLCALLTITFKPNSAFVFLYQFPVPPKRNFRLLLFVIKTILYGIWKFRNKATFYNGKENSSAISRYICQDMKRRILIDKHRFSPNKFRSLWAHPALCHFRDNDNLVFNI